MEWIDFSRDHESIVPASPGLVWRHLVEPSLMNQGSVGTIVAVTVEGEPGMAGHTFFTERTCERHRPCILKTKVLKSEPLSIWATLTETEEFCLRDYYTLAPLHGGTWTQIHLHRMVREISRFDRVRGAKAYRNQRIEQVRTAEDEAADYFAAAVVAAMEATG